MVDKIHHWKVRGGWSILMVWIFAVISGCTALPSHSTPAAIQAGQPVEVAYTCRIDNGDLVATTREQDARDEGLPKDYIFRAPRHFGAVQLAAGSGYGGPGYRDLKTFRQEIHARLSEAVVGQYVNEPVTVRIQSQVDPAMTADERILSIRRTRKIKKRVATDTIFLNKYAEKPLAVGDVIEFADGFKMKVLAIDGIDIDAEQIIAEGATVDTPKGHAIYKDAGDHYLQIIQVREGDLYRTGPLVGRVIEVADDYFKVEYGHPFGGRELRCEIVARPAGGDASKSVGAK